MESLLASMSDDSWDFDSVRVLWETNIFQACSLNDEYVLTRRKYNTNTNLQLRRDASYSLQPQT